MGSTWDALRRAEQDRNESAAAQSEALDQLTQDIASLRVAVHSLEDRLELQLGGLSDDLRQALAKAEDLSAARGRAAEERLSNQFGWLTQASESGRRRLDAITALFGFTALLMLFRC